MGALLGQRQGAAGTQTFRNKALGEMIIVWSPQAVADLAALRAFIAEDDKAAARRIALHIIHNVEELLSRQPSMGRAGRVPGTRELVIPRTPYIVPYRVRDNRIQVLRVYHGARKWPERF